MRWKDVCKRDMTEAGLKEDNATSGVEWRDTLISYRPYRRPQMTGQARDEEEDVCVRVRVRAVRACGMRACYYNFLPVGLNKFGNISLDDCYSSVLPITSAQHRSVSDHTPLTRSR